MSKIKAISFNNYKIFSEDNEVELRPITLLVGKNSSGKSSILKLASILQTATSSADAQLRLSNDKVSLGSKYEDLFHNHSMTDLSLGIEYESGLKLCGSYIINKGILYRVELSVIQNDHTQNEFYISPKKEHIARGLVSTGLFTSMGLSVDDVKYSMNYIGPVRKVCERTVDFGGINNFEDTGYNGTNVYSILLDSYLQDKVLFNSVSTWMKDNLEGQELVIEQNSPTSGTYSFFIKRNNVEINIADVGQGISQLLPIIVESYMDNKRDIVAIEQPALHVHPDDHPCIIHRLAESAKALGKKYLIETHSENILLGLRDIVSDSNVNFDSNDVLIYFVDFDEEEGVSSLQRIEIAPDGRLSSWPEGVFGKGFDLLSRIMSNQK